MEAFERAIVHLAQNLGLRCVAEGVETIEQVEFLKRIGCDEVQGYHFGRPMPEAEMTALLSELPRGAARKIALLQTPLNK